VNCQYFVLPEVYLIGEHRHICKQTTCCQMFMFHVQLICLIDLFGTCACIELVMPDVLFLGSLKNACGLDYLIHVDTCSYITIT
jgi:hypothetical protein